jgi:hypothetical protein
LQNGLAGLGFFGRRWAGIRRGGCHGLGGGATLGASNAFDGQRELGLDLNFPAMTIRTRKLFRHRVIPLGKEWWDCIAEINHRKTKFVLIAWELARLRERDEATRKLAYGDPSLTRLGVGSWEADSL